jgi:myo-inositol 2-dehydrogenase/D-chiro-inositol 1-dehydrogenase
MSMKRATDGGRIRVGMLSFAHYHANFWSEVFARSAEVEFVGLWDDDPQRGAQAAATHGAPWFRELDALLARCDAVAICSQTARHRELIERAAQAGCHMLCEKPLAGSREDCAGIVRAVRGADVTFMQSFPKRFDPVNHALRDFLARGALGRIWMVRVRHGHSYALDAEFAGKWYCDPAQAGGGALMDEGVHGADFLRWLFGDPQTVSATLSIAQPGATAEDAGIAVYRWADGMLAELAAGWKFAAADASIEVFGTLGTALIAGVDLASRDITTGGYLRVYLGGDKRWTESSVVPRFKTGNFHQQNALAFVRALADGTPPPISLDDGVRAVEMILAAYDSVRLGRAQRIAGGQPKGNS